MRTMILQPSELEDWGQFFSKELNDSLEDRDFHVAGAEFLNEPAGLLAWRENGEEAELLSIYVDPGARRLGIGTELIREMRSAMGSGIQAVTFSYTEEGEHESLTPFLESLGAQIEANVYPLGLTTVKEAVRKLEEVDIQNGKTGSFEQLSAAEKNLVYRWIQENLELKAGIYLEQSPGFVCVKDNAIKALLLMRNVDEEDTIYLDYLWGENNFNSLMEVLASFHDHLKGLEGQQDRLVHMILINPKSVNLYTRLIAKPADEITLCNGFFEPALIGEATDEFVRSE